MTEPTGNLKEIDLRGYLIPKNEDNTPLLLEIPEEGDDLLLPVFSSPDTLARGLVPVGYTTPPDVATIEDPYLFLVSIPEYSKNGRRIRIVVDPYPEKKGDRLVTRYFGIDREASIELYQSNKKNWN